MSNSNADPQPVADDPVRPGYRPRNRVDPLPRQWQREPQQQLQRQLQQPMPAQAFVHTARHPATAGAWQARPARRTEFAALLGLWLLVALATVAIALRFMDLSSVLVKPAHPEPGAAGAEAAAQAVRMASYLPRSAAVSDDPFDDPVPAPVTAADPATPAAPMQSLAVATMPAPSAPTLTRVPTLTTAPAAAEAPGAQAPLRAAAPEATAQPSAAPPSACPEALRAMQLCSGKGD